MRSWAPAGGSLAWQQLEPLTSFIAGGNESAVVVPLHRHAILAHVPLFSEEEETHFSVSMISSISSRS